MRRAPPISLTPLEQARLEAWAALRRSAERLAVRAQVVLEASRGNTNGAIALKLGIDPETVGRWRRRFALHRIEGVWRDAPRSGHRTTVSAALIERIVRLTAGASAPNGARWTTRTLARALKVNHMVIHRVWQAYGLAGGTGPSRIDALFRGRSVRIDLRGVYVGPPASAVVFRVRRSLWDGRAPLLGSAIGISGAYPGTLTPHVPPPLAGFLSEVDSARAPSGGPTATAGSAHGLLVFLRSLDEEPEPPLSELHVIFDRPLDLLPSRVTEWLRSHAHLHRYGTAPEARWISAVEGWVRGFAGTFVQPESFREVGSLLESLAEPGVDVRLAFCWRHAEAAIGRRAPSPSNPGPRALWLNTRSV